MLKILVFKSKESNVCQLSHKYTFMKNPKLEGKKSPKREDKDRKSPTLKPVKSHGKESRKSSPNHNSFDSQKVVEGKKTDKESKKIKHESKEPAKEAIMKEKPLIKHDLDTAKECLS